MALVLAAAQTEAVPAPPVCPTLILSASPEVRLVATDLTAWIGPMLELQLASTEQETAGFDRLEVLRISGKNYVGGQLGRRVDDQGRYSFALGFEPEMLGQLAGATDLELVAKDGAVLRYKLVPVDAAALKDCINRSLSPNAPQTHPETRRTHTFLPLEPNQPLRLRYRGNPANLYPEAPLREYRHGATRVALTIGTSGRITDCQLVASSGHEDLDQAACRAARTAVYLPETNADGQPVAVKREQVIEWKIGD